LILRRQLILSSGGVRENQKRWKREQAQHVIPPVGYDLELRTANCFASHASTILRPECDKITRRANQSKPCPALPRKIFRFRRRANQWFDSARLTRCEGRIAVVTNVRWDAVDA
jgi:hypothetical protein